MSVDRQLLQEAARLLSTISERESAARSIRAMVYRMKPGQVIKIHGQPVTTEQMGRVADELEAEIAETKQRAKEMQDRAMGKKG